MSAQNIRSFGHRVDFKHYSNEQGFYSPNIRNIYQDSKGRLWVCCQDGLWVYDGRTFTSFANYDQFGSFDVGSVCEDDEGGIWIGANIGLCLYKNKKIVRIDTSGGKMPKRISWSLFKDLDGTMWAGTHNGVFHFDPKKPQDPLIKSYFVSATGEGTAVRLIKRKKDGSLMLGSEKEYYILKGQEFVRINAPERPVYSLIEFDNGIEWFSGWGSPVTQFKDLKYDKEIGVGSGVLSLTKDKLNNVWLSTFDKGVFKYDGKEIVNYSSNEGLNFNAFWSSLTDKEGNVWFGSFGNGLYKYSGEAITSISSKNGLFNEVLISMKQDTSGKVWMTAENVLSCYDPKLNTVTNYTALGGRVFSTITNMEITANNEVLALGYGGWGFKYHEGKITSESWIGGFAATKGDSNSLYISGEYGLYKKSMNGEMRKVQSKRPTSNSAINLYTDKKGRIWMIDVFTGIGYYAKGDFYKFNKKNGFITTPATCVYGGERDTLWIGTRGKGIYKCVLVNDSLIKRVDSITDKHGLYTNIITSLEVYNGKMYIGTASGIGVMEMGSYEKGVKKVKMYTSEEGLVNSMCTISFIDKDGKVWITTPKGAYIFDTKLEYTNTVEPNIQIKDIQLSYEDVDWMKRGFELDKHELPIALELPYNQNHLTFKFIGISHMAPTKVTYQCKLAGSEEDWSPVSNKNEITYSNISPGTYTFMVRSCNNDGVWNKVPAVFVFVITPPFWRTTWFIALIISVAITGILYTIHYRERKLRKEKLILENKVQERTIELKDALMEVEEKQKEIIDSINYAKRIQKAILASEKVIQKAFNDSFVLFKPKDIVSGDFYWMVQIEDKEISKNIFVFAAADCTGHGVPGAFMSMLNSTLLNQTVHNPNIKTPADVLNFMNEELPKNLRPPEDNENINDGMDIAFCIIDLVKNTLKFCGANNPCWIIRDGHLIELDPTKQAITASTEFEKKRFVDQEIELKKGDCIFVYTDGYADQFGGPKGKKFKYKTLAQLLLDINTESMQKQKQILEQTFENWKGDLEQVDDVCIIGIRIG